LAKRSDFPLCSALFSSTNSEKIPNRKNPGVTFCAYTAYESDYQGDYTYFIGEEVYSFDNLTADLSALVIPAQKYTKFTTKPGGMPNVIKEAWEKIWHMPEQILGGKRAYQTDFEIYDERAADHSNIVLDIYIGIKP
jgi:predicted transcriptional regulator YdeE